jgi:hypothetical protein
VRIKFSERQARQWSISREHGKIKWILIHGVMGWGTTMFMWMTAWKLFTHGQDFVTRREIIIDLIIWPISGFFFGWWMWCASEKAYKIFSGKK